MVRLALRTSALLRRDFSKLGLFSFTVQYLTDTRIHNSDIYMRIPSLGGANVPRSCPPRASSPQPMLPPSWMPSPTSTPFVQVPIFILHSFASVDPELEASAPDTRPSDSSPRRPPGRPGLPADGHAAPHARAAAGDETPRNDAARGPRDADAGPPHAPAASAHGRPAAPDGPAPWYVAPAHAPACLPPPLPADLYSFPPLHQVSLGLPPRPTAWGPCPPRACSRPWANRLEWPAPPSRDPSPSGRLG